MPVTPHPTAFLRILAATAAIALVPAAAAQAATAPSVSTGGAANVKDQTATLAGSVNPRGSATTYFFQYGPTVAYGSSTPAGSAGSGTSEASRSCVSGSTLVITVPTIPRVSSTL